VIRSPAALVGLPAGVVDTWCIPLRPESPALERWRSALGHDERAEAARRRVAGPAWAAARGALRAILGRYLGLPPESLRFERTPLGKPRLVGREAPRFSVAWREELALVGVASDREVGVDLERELEDADVSRLARDHLSLVDQAAVLHAPPAAPADGVLRSVGPARGAAEAPRPGTRGPAAGPGRELGRDRARAQRARRLGRRRGGRRQRLARARREVAELGEVH
jgi:hypothetical protein